MAADVFELATNVEAKTCTLCEGSGAVSTNVGTYSDAASQWYPDLEESPCPRCDGNGRRPETVTVCLVCYDLVDGCMCTAAEIERFVLQTFLGAA